MRKRKMIVAALAMLACANSPQTVWAQQHDANQATKVENGVRKTIPSVKGIVLSADDGLPVIGASIQVAGSKLQTMTDAEGRFELTNVASDSKLKISYIGMTTTTVSPSAQMKVTLQSDSKLLDDVVVTGMFNRKKEGFTGSAVTIKGEDLKKFSTNNVAKSIAAMSPGLNIMDNNLSGSNPNNLPDMRMRGGANMDLGTSQDVLTVQGEYETYANQPLLIMDGFEISIQTLADLDPDRVKSIVILKDAAATAIYGSRAANGVIVIESKTPKPGRIWVTYGGEMRIEAPDLTGYNLMNAQEKLDAELKAGVYVEGGETVDKWQLYQKKLKNVLSGVDTYWLSKPLRTSVQQRHTVTLEGGDDALRYRMYVGYNSSPGVMKNSGRDVLTGMLDFQYHLNKVLLKNSITIDNSTADESNYGSFSQYTKLNPYLSPYDENGNLQKNMDDFTGTNMGMSQYANPLYNTTFNSKNRSKNFSVRELFKVEYTPTKDLRLEGAFSLSKSVGHHDIFHPAQHTDFDNISDPTLKGDYRRTQNESVNWGVDLTASWNKQLNDHYITSNARMSIQENSTDTYGAYVTGFPNDNMDDILFGKKYNEKVTGGESTSRSIGWVLSGGYSYKYKYSVDFNIRLDGSSEFGKNNRWAPFWSTGLRYDLKKESFMKNVSFISDLVLRATYGTTGSQGFSPYQAHSYYTYSLLLPYLSSDGTGANILAMHNENLKWQTTRNTNFALELGLFDHRLTARIEHYNKVTNNLITNISLAPSLGFTTYPENLGKIENKGWEISLSAIPYRNPAKQAYWTVTLNGSHNKDKLVEISEAMRHINEKSTNELKDSPLPRYQEGYSMSSIWVVPSLGIDPATGDEILVKRNGELTNQAGYSGTDAVPYGNTEPTWQGYINSSFTYMGLGVDVSFRYKFGGQVYNQTLVDKVENANLAYNADRRVTQLRWQKPGDHAMFRALNPHGAGTKATSRFVMDENVFQGSTLSFYYRMDTKNARFIKNWGLSSAKLGFTMEDLFYLSSVKRERGLDYPFSRQFTFSLNVAF